MKNERTTKSGSVLAWALVRFELVAPFPGPMYSSSEIILLSPELFPVCIPLDIRLRFRALDFFL